jgi:hypothetical protein
MIRKTIAAALLASTAPLAAAQAPAQAPAAIATAPSPAADPARLAAARRFVDEALPQSFLEQMVSLGVQSAAEEHRNNTDAARRDPHHAERARIMERVAGEEAIRIMRGLDPSFRALFADFYARRMSVADLEEGTRFYSSPLGKRFMAGSINMATSPEYNRSMEALGPAFIASFAGVEQRFAAAMADLPPIPGMPVPPPGAPTATVTLSSPTPPVVLPPLPAVDPARLAAGASAVDTLWPSDIVRRPLNMLPAIEALIAMRVGDFGLPIPPDAGINPNATLGELATGFDPHFRHRLPVLARFGGEELARATIALEPDWRRVLAHAYAREFTAPELEQMTQFFGSPGGRRLIDESVRAMEDPQLVRGTILMLPGLIMQFPAIQQRIEQATAHLPPVPAASAPVSAPPSNRRRRR